MPMRLSEVSLNGGYFVCPFNALNGGYFVCPFNACQPIPRPRILNRLASYGAFGAVLRFSSLVTAPLSSASSLST
jgi:hypothetical protein